MRNEPPSGRKANLAVGLGEDAAEEEHDDEDEGEELLPRFWDEEAEVIIKNLRARRKSPSIPSAKARNGWCLALSSRSS